MPLHVESVQREYTDDELLTFAREAARVMSEISRLEDEKKQAADHFKSQISEREVTVNELTKKINLGYEIREVACDVLLNTPTSGMKSYVSQKTLETIRVVPMTAEDRQLGLYDGSADND